eukprot:scaffold549_cov385-Prasinococcus_capsulatus_cf.AAC.33
MPRGPPGVAARALNQRAARLGGHRGRQAPEVDVAILSQGELPHGGATLRESHHSQPASAARRRPGSSRTADGTDGAAGEEGRTQFPQRAVPRAAPQANNLLHCVVGVARHRQQLVARAQRAVQGAGDGVRPTAEVRAHNGRLGAHHLREHGVGHLAPVVTAPIPGRACV